MEEVFTGFASGILRALKWLFINAIVETLLYGCGRAALRLVTLGGYPKKDDSADTRCVLAGCVVIGLLLFTFAAINAH